MPEKYKAFLRVDRKPPGGGLTMQASIIEGEFDQFSKALNKARKVALAEPGWNRVVITIEKETTDN